MLSSLARCFYRQVNTILKHAGYDWIASFVPGNNPEQKILFFSDIDTRVSSVGRYRRKISLMKSNAKCLQLTNFTCKETLRQVFICLKHPSLLGYCLGWSSNFVGSKSGQIRSVKLLQYMDSTHPPPPTSHALSVCTVL
jgi:hypothetical protein